MAKKTSRPICVNVQFESAGVGAYRDLDAFLFYVVGRTSDGSGTELREGGLGDRDHDFLCRNLGEAKRVARKAETVLKRTRRSYRIAVSDIRVESQKPSDYLLGEIVARRKRTRGVAALRF